MNQLRLLNFNVEFATSNSFKKLNPISDDHMSSPDMLCILYNIISPSSKGDTTISVYTRGNSHGPLYWGFIYLLASTELNDLFLSSYCNEVPLILEAIFPK